MIKLRANYLNPDWECTVCHHILAATWDWFSHIQSLNSLLANTALYFSDASLHEKLEAGLDPKLTCCNANKVDKIVVLQPWAPGVKCHDKNHHADLKCTWEVMEEVFNRCEDSGKDCHNNNGLANAATYTANTGTATSAAIAGTIQCLAALTSAKCEQLDNNNGCQRCHHLNIYHISKNCLNGFPDTAAYTRDAAVQF